MENVFENYERQEWYEKELIIVLNQDDMDRSIWENRAKHSQGVTVFQLPEKTTLGECLNYGISHSKHDIIAKFDDDDYYTSNYLHQQMEALIHMKADLVCKRTVYVYFESNQTLAVHMPRHENKFATNAGGIKGSTLVFKKKIIDKVKFPKLNLSEDYEFIKKCLKRKYKVYLTDKCNYTCLRSAVMGHHTWNIRDDNLLRRSEIICHTDDYKPLITVENNVIHRISTRDKKIALTFDDGPDPTFTPQILNILKQYGAKATFFVVGRQLQQFPELAERIAAEGHDIGNHTLSHPDLATMTLDEIKQELVETDRMIRHITGLEARFFRPPYLSSNHKVDVVSNALGYVKVMHSIESNDFRKSGVDKIVKAVVSKLIPGDIVLLHDAGEDRTQTVKAVEKIMKKVQNKSFQCVRLTELIYGMGDSISSKLEDDHLVSL